VVRSPLVDPLELAGALKALQDWAVQHAPAPECELRRRIVDHLGSEPAALPVVRASFGVYERPNLHVALEAWREGEGRGCKIVGMSSEHGYRMGIAELAQRGGSHGFVVEPGPIEYATVRVGERTLVCVSAGLFFLRDGEAPLVALLGSTDHGMQQTLDIQVMTSERSIADAFLGELRALMAQHNVFRGRVVEVAMSPHGGMTVEVRALPDVPRERLVLPDGVLERIERHTLGVARHADRLRAAGRHLKRGLLLHGPPGTGKTLTAMHLAGRMPDRTILLLTGMALHALGPAIAMARSLQPAMVVLEDVDLVAMDRAYFHANPVLFELLNQMDGLAEDADIIFLLTSNRPEGLEQALAQRPGRIDQAIELPLPDAAGRLKLLELYGEGLDLRASDLAPVVERTVGASPAFIRELTRRAALLAADARPDAPIAVSRADLEAALAELQQDRERLTATLLGRQEGDQPAHR